MLMAYDIAATFIAVLIASWGTQHWATLSGAAGACPAILVLALVNVVVFWFFHMYSSLWRYASISEAGRIVAAVTVGSVIGDVIFNVLFGKGMTLREDFMAWAVVLIICGGGRFAIRAIYGSQLWRFKSNSDAHLPRTLIVGAGETGSLSIFLSAAAAAGSDVIQPAFAALANDINLYDATHYLAELATIKKLFINDAARAQMLSQLIKYADIGIDGMDVRQSEGVMGLKDSLIGLDEIPEEARNKIAEDFKLSFAYDLFFHHKGSGDGFWLGSTHESEGTKAALAFFSVALRSLSSGATTVIDELDSSLHPTLLRDFVSLFADPDTNPKGAQLIFSTHDVTLMTRTSPMEEVLERDQVWFVEKDSEGASQLIAAMEYSPRANENLGRNYLNGVYVPLPNPSFHQLVAQLMKEGADIDG